VKKNISKHKFKIIFAVIGLALIFGVAKYIQISLRLHDIATVNITQLCIQDEKKVEGLDCKKLEVEWPFPNESEGNFWGIDGWQENGMIRNEKDEIIWGASFVIHNNGEIEKLGYGSSKPPKDWQKQIK
jgi:hypothetical protein